MNIVHSPPLGGGRTAYAYAYIKVTYPAGSTCTCSNGTKTLTAKDTSGSYVFPIPEAGAWTVRAYDGPTWESSDNKASKIVNIVEQYQIENVVLSYRLYIYNNGDLCIDATGGWGRTGWSTSFYNGDPEFQTDRLHFQGGSPYRFTGTLNAIDLTDYSTAYMEYTTISASAYYDTCFESAGLNNNKSIGSVVSFKTTSQVGTFTMTKDITNLTGNYYFYIAAIHDAEADVFAIYFV